VARAVSHAMTEGQSRTTMRLTAVPLLSKCSSCAKWCCVGSPRDAVRACSQPHQNVQERPPAVGLFCRRLGHFALSPVVRRSGSCPSSLFKEIILLSRFLGADPASRTGWIFNRRTCLPALCAAPSKTSTISRPTKNPLPQDIGHLRSH
jgi:hypothetical protein